MKGLTKILVSVLISILCFACDSAKKEMEVLKEEVIGIHDEVMPLMGDLKSEQKRILQKAEVLMKADSVGNKAEVESIERKASALEEAYEGMFVWMRQYKGDLAEMTKEEAIGYLKEQKEKVLKVNEDIKKALEEAKKVEE